MKNAVLVVVFCFALGLETVCAASGEETHAAQAVRESGAGSVHAGGSAAHALVASGQVISAVSSVPLAVGGVSLSRAGVVSTSAAVGMSRTATASAAKPLPLTDASLVTVPPDQALTQP